MAARARQYVCPICAREVAPRDTGNPSFPFCSPACKLVDLGRWLDGAYRVPGEPDGSEGEDMTGDARRAPREDDE